MRNLCSAKSFVECRAPKEPYMHSSLSRESLLQFVMEFARPDWVGIIGSAAHDAEQFCSTSDLDLVVQHQGQNQFVFASFGDRPAEIILYSPGSVRDIYDHPEWFDVQWLWELAKFATAETLFGECDLFPVTSKARLVGVLGMIGHVLINRRKRERSRVMADGEDSLPLLALRHLIDHTYPRNRDMLQDDTGLEYVDCAQSWLQPVLRQFLPEVLFFPQHYHAASWLNDRWKLNLTIPVTGTPY